VISKVGTSKDRCHKLALVLDTLSLEQRYNAMQRGKKKSSLAWNDGEV